MGYGICDAKSLERSISPIGFQTTKTTPFTEVVFDEIILAGDEGFVFW
jgi:hypothetical protein